MDDDVAIKVDGVSKNFKLPHEKTNSLKSTFLQRVKGGKRKYEVQHALKDISFEVKKGEFFGIVGRNGSGKSTLLKILAEIYKPTEGSTRVSGKLVPFIELGVGFNPELTGKDNVYLSASLLGFSRKEISDMYDDIVQFAELEKFMDQKLKNYSSGMQVRLAFSIATRSKADILLIDEVLAVGDADFQRKCYEYFKLLKKNGKTIVFVTHDMSAVREYCDRALMINRSEIIIDSSPDQVADAYLKLFNKTIGKKELDLNSTRWGSRDVEFCSVKSRTTKSEVVFTFCIKNNTNKDISGMVLGLAVKTIDGKLVCGTSTSRHIGTKGFLMPANSVKTVTYKASNIFGAGTYQVHVSLKLTDNITIYDNWDGATVFRNTYEKSDYFAAILPGEMIIE